MAKAPDLISATDIASMLGVHVSTVLRRAERLGIQPALKTGNSNLFRGADLRRIADPPPMGRPAGAKRKGAK